MLLAIILSVVIIAIMFIGFCSVEIKPFEFDHDPIDAPGEGFPSITYDEIVECERPYIDHSYN